MIMKKILPFFLMLLMLMAWSSTMSFGQEVTFVPVWAHFGETAPAWFTDGVDPSDPSHAASERGIVYNDVSGHVYVSSRHPEDTDADGVVDTPEPHVYILDPETGKAPAFGVSSLLTLDIKSADANYGGGYPLNNVTVSEDGSIFASNMTLASGEDILIEDYTLIKAFRVYRWSWEQDKPEMIIDYRKGGYRLGDKFSVIGNYDTLAYIYAVPGEGTKVLQWKVTSGVVASEPEVIQLQDIAGVGTSATVAPSLTKDDWVYISGKGLYPTLFKTTGENLGQVQISPDQFPSSVIAGRTIEFAGKNLMAMFSGDQSAFVFDITKNGDNVTDADVIGFTPTFGTKYANAYGEGAVEFGIIDDSLYVFICAPTNGIACFRIDGLVDNTSVEEHISDKFELSVYPNPATDFARVRFTLPADAYGPVSVKLYDVSGKFVGITPEKAVPGQQEITINTSNMPSGIYTYQLKYNNMVGTGKLLVK